MALSIIPEADLDGIAFDLADQGLAIRDGLLPPDLVDQLAAEGRELWTTGGLQPARIGRGQDRHTNQAIRTDRIKWLDPATASPAQRQYLAILEDLRLAINRYMYLGLFEFEGHLAVYPPGAFYRKHLDQFRGIGQRLVTAILYLNPQWLPEDGGQLRLYPDLEGKESLPVGHWCAIDIPPGTPPGKDSPLAGDLQEIQPIGGRLVCFLSSRFPHEVLPATRFRVSITGWFRARNLIAG